MCSTDRGQACRYRPIPCGAGTLSNSDSAIMTCSTTGGGIIDHVKTQSPCCVGTAVVSFALYVIFGFVL